MVKEVSDPKYSTAVGLVLYGLNPEVIRREFLATNEKWTGQQGQLEDSGSRGIVERMTRWFQEL